MKDQPYSGTHLPDILKVTLFTIQLNKHHGKPHCVIECANVFRKGQIIQTITMSYRKCTCELDTPLIDEINYYNQTVKFN